MPGAELKDGEAYQRKGEPCGKQTLARGAGGSLPLLLNASCFAQSQPHNPFPTPQPQERSIR